MQGIHAVDDIRPFAGNHVIIDAEGFYVFVAHLRLGSVRVEVGDKMVFCPKAKSCVLIDMDRATHGP